MRDEFGQYDQVVEAMRCCSQWAIARVIAEGSKTTSASVNSTYSPLASSDP